MTGNFRSSRFTDFDEIAAGIWPFVIVQMITLGIVAAFCAGYTAYFCPSAWEGNAMREKRKEERSS